MVLDRHLDHQVELVLYGRAAIALGFETAPSAISLTLDVDVIVPSAFEAELDADEKFWNARDATNAELQTEGLYITHIFPASMVFLRRRWENAVVPIERPRTRWLRLFRPATVDLVLTKMMRGADAQDMADARFLIEHEGLTRADLEEAFAVVSLPDLQELNDAFAEARPLVLAMVR